VSDLSVFSKKSTASSTPHGLTYDEVLIIDPTPPFLRPIGSKRQSRAHARRVRKGRKMKAHEKKNAKTFGGY